MRDFRLLSDHAQKGHTRSLSFLPNHTKAVRPVEDIPVKNTQPTVKQKTSVSCYHCGEPCDTSIADHEKYFCCDGCKFVYQLLEETGLCTYYELSDKPGIKVKGK